MANRTVIIDADLTNEQARASLLDSYAFNRKQKYFNKSQAASSS
jgi:hypothetical protein